MSSIRIQRFGGINTEVTPRLAPDYTAQIAHNCLLWDGALRPMAKWIQLQGELNNRYSVKFDGTNIYTINLLKARQLTAPVYVAGTIIGLNPSLVDQDRSNICYQNKFTQIDQIVEVGVSAPVVSNFTTINWTSENLSVKPVNRIYACSLVRSKNGKLEESPLVIIPGQDFTTLRYEGDACDITLRISDAPVRENCYIRLYRSISELETGHEIANPLDTDWYLVAEIQHYVAYQAGVFREYRFIDGGSPVTGTLDTYLAKSFYAPLPITFNHLDYTEGGWLVAGTNDGQIQVSERYLTHAWPIENKIFIPEGITDIVCHYDNIYIGTKATPYIVTIGLGESSNLQINPKPYHEDYPCLAGTMARIGSGALYASAAGLVSLSLEGMRVITAAVARGVRALYHAQYTDTAGDTQCTDLAFQDTTYGAYLRGQYYGFCSVPTVDNGIYLSLGYLFDTGSTLDGEHPLSKLITFDYPAVPTIAHCLSDDGLVILNTTSMWVLPLPNMKNKDSYRQAQKQCYLWKSKKFIFPGQMTFAYAKVVHDCDGFVRLKLFCDGICVYDTSVPGSLPIALPPQVVGVEWEVEVHGTATVHEIHVAPSIEELLE